MNREITNSEDLEASVDGRESEKGIEITPEEVSHYLDNPKLKLPDYEKYHDLGPCDVRPSEESDPWFMVQIQRQVESLEQIAIQIPVYKSDTKKLMEDRIAIGYEIIRARLDYNQRAIAEIAKLGSVQEAKTRAMQAKIERLEKMLKGVNEDKRTIEKRALKLERAARDGKLSIGEL